MIEMNLKQPDFCHVRCVTTPSMKTGKYNVYILFGKEGELVTIEKATCECAAGYDDVQVLAVSAPDLKQNHNASLCRESASCTHVSALLHAMTAMSCTHPFQQPAGDLQNEDEDDENARPLPVTSYVINTFYSCGKPLPFIR